MAITQLNVRLDADLVTAARLYCLESAEPDRMTLREVVEAALRSYLKTQPLPTASLRGGLSTPRLPAGRPKRKVWPDDVFVILDGETDLNILDPIG